MFPLLCLLNICLTPTPQIPFEIYDVNLKRTIHVRASCETTDHTIVVYFEPQFADIHETVFVAVNTAFKTDGITIVNICRVRGNE